MNIIQEITRHQMQFNSLDDFIGTENAVRIIDAFLEKLDLVKLGISSTKARKQQPKKSNPGGSTRFNGKLLLKPSVAKKA